MAAGTSGIIAIIKINANSFLNGNQKIVFFVSKNKVARGSNMLFMKNF